MNNFAKIKKGDLVTDQKGRYGIAIDVVNFYPEGGDCIGACQITVHLTTGDELTYWADSLNKASE